MTDIREVIIEVRPLLHTYLNDTKDGGPWVTCLQKLETRAIEMARALVEVPGAISSAVAKERAELLGIVVNHCSEPATVAALKTAIPERTLDRPDGVVSEWEGLANELAAVFPSQSERRSSNFASPSLDEIKAGEAAAVDAFIAASRRLAD